MAETAKSMNFGADATLVSAAGALAKEMGPGDMTDSFDKVIEARGELLDSVQKNFKLGLLAIDGANAELKETMEVLNKKLNNGDLTNAQREEMQLKMEDYRARMKAIPRGRKGKQQRDDLMYEINREIKTAKNRDEAMTDVLSTINNNLYDPTQLDANYINFLEQIAKDSAEEETGPGFSKTKNEKGETVYSYTYTDEAGEQQVIEGDIYDIQKKINGTKKDYEFIKTQNEVIFGWQDWATKHPNAKFEEVHDRIASDMETSFAQSPNKFKSMINHPMGWSKKSYVETLRDTESDEFKNIVKVLDEMGADEFDNDGDGSITEKDFVTEENINTMIKALTDPSPTERRTAHKAAATFYADTEAKKAFDFGVRDRPKDGGGEGGSEEASGHVGANMPGIGWVHAEKFEQFRAHIDRGEDFTGNYGTYKFDAETGTYTDADGNELTRYEVANQEGADKGDPPNMFVWTVDTERANAIEEAALRGEITPEAGDWLNVDGSLNAKSAADRLNAKYNMAPSDGRGYYLNKGQWIANQSDVMFMFDGQGEKMKWTQELIDQVEDITGEPFSFYGAEVGNAIRWSFHEPSRTDYNVYMFNILMQIPPFKKASDELKNRTQADIDSGVASGAGANYPT
jgi:hypothetical protein